ncbi:MAG: GGDEF domain-containing protein [Alphaproteobacteria bacterium]
MVNITNQTLLEQMHITDREIEMRKRLFDFTDKDVAHLVACKERVAENLDAIVDEFYAIQVSHPEVALVIGDAETLNRLKASMRRYIVELFEGYYDAEYVNKRLRVGKIHKRIGVTPKLYMSAIRLLQSILTRYVERDSAQKHACSACQDQRLALQKLILFDTQLVFDTYIGSLMSELESAKSDVEDYATSLEEKVALRTRQLSELSSRDPLTGLYNQRTFYESLRRELAVAERGQHPVSLVYFDLNGFKKVNDSEGHKTGDALLELVAATLREVVREGDWACRYGGDEFCIILPRTRTAEARGLCQRLIERFDGKPTRNVTFSLGIAETGPATFIDMNQLVRNADALMYVAKAESKINPGHHIRTDSAEQDAA